MIRDDDNRVTYLNLIKKINQALGFASCLKPSFRAANTGGAGKQSRGTPDRTQ